MNLETWRQLLLWSTVINYVCLAFWGAIFIAPHGWMYRVHGGVFHLRPDQIDMINYGGIVFYKLIIVFFCLFPYIILLCIT